MSASNWSECPRCAKRAVAERDRLRKQAKASYGKLPEDEWRDLSAKANATIQLEETLREDYEQGVNVSGLYELYYGCSCDRCGYSFEFKHKVQTEVGS